MHNSVLWDTISGSWGPITAYCCVEGGGSGPGDIGADPQFVRHPSPGPDGVWGTPDDDYGDLRLQPTSPCIDAGDPASSPAGQDIAGMPRLLDGDLDGAMRIDMGAHEFGHVRLGLTTPVPNQVDLALTGTPGLPVVLAVGTPAASGLLVAPFGELALDFGQPLLVAPVGSPPQTLSFAYPSGTNVVACQALAVGGSGGNVSNAESLTVL